MLIKRSALIICLRFQKQLLLLKVEYNRKRDYIKMEYFICLIFYIFLKKEKSIRFSQRERIDFLSNYISSRNHPLNTNSGVSEWNNILREILGLNILAKILRLLVVKAKTCILSFLIYSSKLFNISFVLIIE